jgi:L-iditol 2-dehydrogenase
VKALIKKTTEEKLHLEELPEPKVGPGQVKIEVKFAGICGTDYHILHNEYMHNLPLVPGHEFSGIICETGLDVINYQVNDRVVALTTYYTCGVCEYCISGVKMLCKERQSFGTHVNGAFAKYIVLDQNLLFKIPDNVSFEEAVLTEPLACCVRGLIEMSRIRSTDFVLVSGPGTIGLLAQQIAQIEGGTVLVCGSDKDSDRLNKAKELGAYQTINATDDLFATVMELTGGEGVDVAIECAGVEISAQNCIKLLKPGGSYHQMGLFGKPVKFDLDALLRKEAILTTSYASTYSSFKKSLRLMSLNKVSIKPLISEILPMTSWEEGFQIFADKSGYKVLLYPI